jgi:hypothetical protein
MSVHSYEFKETYKDNMKHHCSVSTMTRLHASQIEKQGSIPSIGISSSQCSKTSCRNLVLVAILVSDSCVFFFSVLYPFTNRAANKSSILAAWFWVCYGVCLVLGFVL